MERFSNMVAVIPALISSVSSHLRAVKSLLVFTPENLLSPKAVVTTVEVIDPSLEAIWSFPS